MKIKKNGIIVSRSDSDIKKRHQHPHGLREGPKCQIRYECQILVPVDMNIVLI